jgi:hypothetical protein
MEPAMSESQGGLGGDRREMIRRSEMRLTEQSIRHRWSVPRPARERAIERIHEILDSEESSNRERLAAVRVLLMASRLNADIMHRTLMPHDHEVHTRSVDVRKDPPRREPERESGSRRPTT